MERIEMFNGMKISLRRYYEFSVFNATIFMTMYQTTNTLHTHHKIAIK